MASNVQYRYVTKIFIIYIYTYIAPIFILIGFYLGNRLFILLYKIEGYQYVNDITNRYGAQLLV